MAETCVEGGLARQALAKRYNRTYRRQNSALAGQLLPACAEIGGNACSAYHLATIGLIAGWRANLAGRRQPSDLAPCSRRSVAGIFPENQAPIAARGVGRYTAMTRFKVVRGVPLRPRSLDPSELVGHKDDNTAINQGVLDERGGEAIR
jgi:hypothetical protein